LTHKIAYLNESEEFLGYIYIYIYIWGCGGGAKGARGLGRQLSGKGAIWRFVALGGVRYQDIYCMCVWIWITSITCQPGNQDVCLASSATVLFGHYSIFGHYSCM